MQIAEQSAPMLTATQQLAHGFLADQAATVDASTELSSDHLAALTEAGLWGCMTLGDPVLVEEIGELLASACLSTAFVWGQHQGAILRLASARPDIRDHWMPRVLAGTAIAGVTYAGLPSHGGVLHLTRDGANVTLCGRAPFVTSWPWMRILVTWALERETGQVHCLVIENPQHIEGITATPLTLIAATASATYRLEFADVKVDGACIAQTRPAATAQKVPIITQKYNSLIGLGVLRSIENELADYRQDDALLNQSSRIRAQLNDAVAVDDASKMIEARARLLSTVTRSADILYRCAGAKSAGLYSIPSRLLRAAAFIQSAGTTQDERLLANQLDR